MNYEYENYLNEEGEIDEDLVRQDLEKDSRLIEAEVAERLEKALEDEREIVNNDGSTTFLSKDELESLRPCLEEQIRQEVENEDEADLEDALAQKMQEYREEKEYNEMEVED